MANHAMRKYGVEATIDFELYEIDGVDLRVDWVPVTADCEIMKDGGASTECTNDATDEGSTYSIVLTATEMQAARLVLKIVDADTKAFLDKVVIIETYGNASAQHAFDLDTASQIVASVSGNVDGNVTGSVASNLELGPAEVNTEVDNSMITYGLDHLIVGSVADEVADNSIIAKMTATGADWSTFAWSTDSLQSIRDKQTDIETDTAQIGTATDTNIATDIANLDTNLNNVQKATVTKNAAYANFQFPMKLTSDHFTAATGKSVSGERSLDAGAFGSVSGTIAEVSDGMYQFDADAADTNADSVTWRFFATDCDDTVVHIKTST